MTTARIELPRKLIPVFSGEADVRGSYGGRGSGKTRSFAKMTAVRAYMWAMAGREGIVLCGRQYMNSLDDSSLEEIKAAIQSEPWLNDFFDIGEKYIKTRDGRISYKFSGLDRNINSVKSKARILLCWVDEAEPVTDEAWRVLIPTLREEDSELWVTWNPQRKGSPTDRRFRQTKDPRYKVELLNWRDNQRFPAVLERARRRDLVNSPDEYDHIWEGAYGNISGSILGRMVSAAEREGRIHNNVEFDQDGAAIEVSGDLGFRDTAAWWYWQRVSGGFNLLKYEGDSGLDADDWIPRIQDSIRELGAKGVGKVWLPHDSRAKTFQSKHTSMEKFIAGFGASRVALVPQSKKLDQISAARAVLPKCAFNADNCESGIDGIRAWEYVYNDDLGVYSREPLHNWACFVAGTLVKTPTGEVSIESLLINDLVCTPSGTKRVTASHVYMAHELVEIITNDGRKVVCTANHKHFTSSGLVPSDALSYGDVLFTGKETSWRMIMWTLMVAGITGIHEAITDSCQPRSKVRMAQGTGNIIVTYGRLLMEKSLMVMKSIISTITHQTMKLRTYSYCHDLNTSDTMGQRAVEGPRLGTEQRRGRDSTQRSQRSSGEMVDRKRLSGLWSYYQKLGNRQKSGMEANPDLHGIPSTERKFGLIANSTRSIALCAVRCFLHIGRIEAYTAGRIVGLRRIVREQKVYDLTVDLDHCFIAGGVLTSNSHPSDSFAYGCQVMSDFVAAKKPEEANYAIKGVNGRIVTATLDELWKEAPERRTERY